MGTSRLCRDWADPTSSMTLGTEQRRTALSPVVVFDGNVGLIVETWNKRESIVVCREHRKIFPKTYVVVNYRLAPVF